MARMGQGDQRMIVARLDILFGFYPIAMFSHLLLGLLNTTAIYLHNGDIRVLVWYAIVFSSTAFRCYHFLSYRQLQNTKTTQQWRYWHGFHCLISAAMWGYAYILLMPDDSLNTQLLMIISCAGLVSGASSTQYQSPWVFVTFMALTLLPMSWRLYILVDQSSILLPLLCWIFMFFMWRTCTTNCANSNDNIIRGFALNKQQRVLDSSSRRLNLQIDSSPLAVIEWDENLRINRWNPAAQDMFGYTTDRIYGSETKVFFDDDAGQKYFERLLKDRDSLSETLDCKTAKGSLISCEWTTATLLGEDNELLGFSSFVRDVSKRMEREALIRRQAFYDTVTGLANRHYFEERLDQELSRASRSDQYQAVFFIDLDNFKNINDSLGHSAGDELLSQFALRLRKRLRGHESIARFGGDEFVILLEDLGSDEQGAQLAAAQLAKSLQSLMQKPFILAGREYGLTCSIGISLFNSDSCNRDELLKQADLALYASKEKGRNAYSFFERDMGEKAARHLQLLNSMRGAIERNEMWLVYQPKATIKRQQFKGAEVLIRWKNKEFGFVSPAEFIPIIESSSLMAELGHWIIDCAMSQLQQWRNEGLWSADNRLSINISPRQLLERGFVDTMIAKLESYPLCVNCVEFEITENVLVQNIDVVTKVLKELTAVGIDFSIDDFGTGYSSLAYLKELPISVLKIDKSFIDHVTDSGNDRAIVKSILSICKELQLTSVAEGVETEPQREALQQLDCDLLQGYLYSKPLPADEIALLLKQQL